MPAHPEIKAEVVKTLHALLEPWAQPGEEAIDDFLAFIADDFMGFGTGPDEHVPNRDALRKLMLREQAHMPYPFTLEVPWMEVRMLHPTLGLGEGELKLEVHAPDHTHVVALRCSLVFKRRDVGWRLVHFHFSVPDAMQNVGDTLMDVLQTRNRVLEREVAQRTAELKASLADLEATQARLVQQEKMASLGALTSGIAHELKNPLNFVNNFAALSCELLDEIEAEADPEARQALLADLRSNAEKIESHGRRADAIITSMLEHARSNSNERRALDLNALVADHVALAWHGWKARMHNFEIEITKAFDAEVGEVEVVPQGIGRVVLNLIGNAFDAVYTHAAQADAAYVPAVTVTTRRTNDQVEIHVADNGPGIPEALMTKVFEPFFTTKPAGSGTGLGLSLSYDIVTQGHGGTLTVSTEATKGATFIVTLPVKTEPSKT